MYMPLVKSAILCPPINLHYVSVYETLLPSSQTNMCLSIRQTNRECCIGKCLLVLRTVHYTTLKVYINEIQQDATVYRYLFTTKLLSTCFGCSSHHSSGEHKTVTTVYGTGHSI